MSCPNKVRAFCAVFALLLTVALVSSAKAEALEEFEATNFDKSTAIDNEWFPIKPGMRYVRRR